MKRLKPGQLPPSMQDCPIKCKHAVPYGSAEFYQNFNKKTLMEKQDIVKKYNLGRKCLKFMRIPHLARECRAPNCSKCGGDHNKTICNNPTGK